MISLLKEKKTKISKRVTLLDLHEDAFDSV
jgi:hypothetical protein